jgi:hypothetical protein
MKIIKLFEAFKKEDYSKAFNHITSLLNNDTPKKTSLRDTFDSVRYYMFPERHDVRYEHQRRDQSTARSFIESQKNQYNITIEKLSHLNITRIKFFCDRFFEIMDWIVETGPIKYEIDRGESSDEQKRVQFEELNDFDMDNEYEEINKITNRVKGEIQILLNIL